MEVAEEQTDGYKIGNSASAGRAHCRGCAEEIYSWSTVCPYCNTAQKFSLWQRAAAVLKWSTGLIIVVVLLVGVLTLNKYYASWQGNKELALELGQSANRLRESGEFRQAWQQYEFAVAVDNTLSAVKNGRVQLAMQWVRQISPLTENDPKAGEKLDEFAKVMMPVLARAVVSTSGRQRADVLAHIGWTYYLLDRNRSDLVLGEKNHRAESMYRDALRIDPKNSYANALLAYALFSKEKSIDEFRRRFEIALQSVRARYKHSTSEFQWLRKLQLDALNDKLNGHTAPTPDTQHVLSAELLRVVNEARNNGESKPAQNMQDALYKCYGPDAQAENLDALLESIPAKDHLKTFSWIFSDKYSNLGKNTIDTQALYIYARLLEAAGDTDNALVMYRQLYDVEYVSETLAVKTDEALERLTGKKTKRALQRLERKYVDDPIPVNADLSEFHSQTILNFDPANPGENILQAMDYYALNSTLHNKEDAVAVVKLLEQSRDRLKKWLAAKQAVVEREGYTSHHTKSKEKRAYALYYRIWELYGTFLVEAQYYEQAILELSQLKERLSVVPDNIYFQLARAYCQRLELTAQKGQRKLSKAQRIDVEQALLNLENYIDTKVRHGGALNWLEVKKDPYLGTVRVTRRFKELFAGRL